MLAGNVIRSLVDGSDFLGRFPVQPVDGSVVLLNYELRRDHLLDWLEALGIRRADRVHVLNLRSHRVPLLDDAFAERLANRLRDLDAEVAILDPAGRAFVAAGGANENDNTEVLRFLARLDEIKTASGVMEMLLPIHGNREVECAAAHSPLDDISSTAQPVAGQLDLAYPRQPVAAEQPVSCTGCGALVLPPRSLVYDRCVVCYTTARARA